MRQWQPDGEGVGHIVRSDRRCGTIAMRRPASSGICRLDIPSPKRRQKAVLRTKRPDQKRRETAENLPKLIVNKTEGRRDSIFLQPLNANAKCFNRVQRQNARLVHVAFDTDTLDERFYGRKNGLRKIATALNGQVRAKLP